MKEQIEKTLPEDTPKETIAEIIKEMEKSEWYFRSIQYHMIVITFERKISDTSKPRDADPNSNKTLQ